MVFICRLCSPDLAAICSGDQLPLSMLASTRRSTIADS